MTRALVPSNHRPIEHALAEVLVPLQAIDPQVIETLWDPWRCPRAYLPFLAYALSVDLWDDKWADITKRKAIAQSPNWHRRKGTRLAVEEALAGLGIDYDLSEWWEVTPTRREGTARVLIPATSSNAEALVIAARRLAYSAKPKSRAIFVGLGEWARGTLFCGGPVFEDETTIIHPYQFTDPNPSGALFFGGIIQTDDTDIITGDTLQ